MKKYLPWLFALLWLISLLYLQHISRTRFPLLWAVYSTAFALYIWLVFKSSLSLKHGIALAIIVRLSCFFSTPLLSDDYYRFIWDGALAHAGINPAAYTPREIASHPEWLQVPEEFFGKLNSPDYYAVYPPAAQQLFHLSFLLNGWHIEGHLLFFRTLLFIADLIILRLLWLLARPMNHRENSILVYGLNPLLILEYTGNLHFDGLMIMGLLAALYFAIKSKYFISSVMMAVSILAKMITFPLIPFLGKALAWNKRMVFTAITIIVTVGCFLISFGEDLHWTQSVALWFSRFEFNASLYYLARAAGHAFKGYNTIAFLGPCLVVAFMLSYAWILIRFYKEEIFTPAQAMLLVLTVYFLFSTTVHPWYLGILLPLGILSMQTFPIVWSYLAYLSYSHYNAGLSEEHYSLIATEYILLAAFMVWEFKGPIQNRLLSRSH